jgi:putative ABC transport system permease protein
MFFITYLRRELRRRMRAATVIALGLALGVGLVITVVAASSGVKKAQAGVLHSLYGVGTDVTVTKKPAAPKPGGGGDGQRIQVGPNGSQVCSHGKCHNGGGQKIDNLGSPSYGPIDATAVAKVAGQHGVKAAAGGLSLTESQITLPKAGQNSMPQPKDFGVNGVDLSNPGLGPLSAATLNSGRDFRAAERNSNVAVVDSSYAKANGLKVGQTITIAKKAFRIIGLVNQPQGSKPPDVYIPLARAQALASGSNGKSMKNQVNQIYVTATSASVISQVQKEISNVLPSATVTTSSSLASQISGSLASTAKLANELGKWLSVLVLIAAFVVASLLTMAAVSRRVREFGTLKALGWRSRRIISQVMGESVATGVIGGAAGVGLGFLGAGLITAIAPELSASVQTASGMRMQSAGPGGPQSSSPTISHTISVPMSASVSVGAIVLAVVLAVGGGLIAGSFGSWRIGRLRPAAALARIA